MPRDMCGLVAMEVRSVEVKVKPILGLPKLIGYYFLLGVQEHNCSV